VKMIEHYREVLSLAERVGATDATDAAAKALKCGLAAAECKRRGAVMEHQRKALQTQMRDALMAADDKLKASPAEAQVRASEPYIAYCNEAAEWVELGEKLREYATYFQVLTGIFAGEVANV